MLNAPVYICDTIRTPIGRYGGALSSVRADGLAALPITELVRRNQHLDLSMVDEVILGCANQAGEDNRNVARMASLLSGLPETVPAMTINRLCGSGLDAVGTAARAIASCELNLVIAGGVESMSRAPFVMGKADKPFSRDAEIYDTTIGWRFVNKLMEERYGVDSMPETAENVAVEFDVSREDQDAFALRSQQRAAEGQARRAEEIIPVEIPQRKGDPLILDKDEHPRADTSLETLNRLKAPFRQNGTVTAGNASGVNDGAAAMLLASEGAVTANQLEPVARVIGMATAGVPPRIMGMGPAPATKKALQHANLSIEDMDVIELNEAFASQALAVLRQLNVPDDAEHVNPNGGAIALGHPLGMSGARLAITAARELKRRGGRYALCTMCIGVGQGIALLLERP
ncbi:MAG: 3-oxoadipyl-CoA thiolase [Pseudomonadota bacterium]